MSFSDAALWVLGALAVFLVLGFLYNAFIKG